MKKRMILGTLALPENEEENQLTMRYDFLLFVLL